MPFSIRPSCSLSLAHCSGFWLVITLLALSSGSAYAGWVTVSENKQEGKTIYVNPDTIR